MDLQRIKDPVRCGPLGVEVSGHCQEQLTKSLTAALDSTITTPYYLSDIQLKDCHFSHWPNHDEVWNKRQANDLKSLPRHLPTLEDDSKRADHLGDIKKVPQNGFLMNPQVITEYNLFCTSCVKNGFNPEPNSVALEGIFCQNTFAKKYPERISLR